MAKGVYCIPNVYGKADRELIDIIKAERYKYANGNALPRFWQVGEAICTLRLNGYYHLYLLEKDIFLRDYRINREGKMIKTNKFYRVYTKEAFFKWCTDRGVNFDLEKCNK